jgi:Cytochrome P460
MAGEFSPAFQAGISRAAPGSIEQLNFICKSQRRNDMRKIPFWLMVTIPAAVLAILGGKAISADKYTVQVPDGLAFSEFRGYEDWQVVAASQTDELIAVILANPVMIEAYRAGVPGNGQHFPDGSKIAKIHWKPKNSADAPAPTTVPDVLHDVDFIERDGKKFPGTAGWGYAQFNYDAASDTFAPEGTGSNCGYTCHTIVVAKDYIFTAYPKR